MIRQTSSSTSPDTRIADLLEILVEEVRGMRENLETCLELLPAQSNGRVVGREHVEQLLTQTQLAGILQIDERTLRELINNGEAPSAVMVGKRRRWRRADVDAWTIARRSP